MSEGTASPDGGRFDIGVIGGGSAAEALVGALDGSGRRVVVFEPALVGGECAYTACMPSKAMLHDAAAGRSWAEAVRRRDRITEHRDDRGHAAELADAGAVLVRDRARVVDATRLRSCGRDYRVDHVVLATGAEALVPPVEGLDAVDADRVWTSADALTARERPAAVVIVGGGVIGAELATMFARFGTEVTLADAIEQRFDHAPERVGEILDDALEELGVDLRSGVEATSVRPADDAAAGVVVGFSDGTEATGERVLFAVGRRARTSDLGLERLGLDPDRPLPVTPTGRLDVDGSVWAMGDVAGMGEYTHLANHHAAVVADHLAGDGTRRLDDAVTPRCVFTDPPIFEVGPTWRDVVDDPDAVVASFDLATFPRAITDDLGPGHLWAAASRSTGRIVAAGGIGPKFDELSHALVVAIDGRVPVATLARSMQPFPTIGEILGPLFSELHDSLGG